MLRTSQYFDEVRVNRSEGEGGGNELSGGRIGERAQRFSRHIVFVIIVLAGLVSTYHPLYGAEPLGETITIGGRLISSDNVGIRSCQVRVIILTDNYPWPALQDTFFAYTNLSGYYSIETGLINREVRVMPIDSKYPVMSDPSFVRQTYVDENMTADFTITPGVELAVNWGAIFPVWLGTEVWAGGYHVATLSDPLSPFSVFYPGHFGLPDTGVLTYRRPFTKFEEQESGDWDQYDCSNLAIQKISGIGRELQTLTENPDTPGLYTWDSPGGLGWSVFPATPDNRLPNSPNVYVEVDFSMTGYWPKEWVRLKGNGFTVFSQTDLLNGNGHVAKFLYPIEGCGRDEFRVEVYFEGNYGGPEWWPLTESKNSGTSNADLNNDSEFNITDAGFFANALSKCEGVAGYLPCADYNADGCVNLGDAQYFNQMLYNYPSKAKSGATFDAAVDLVEVSNGVYICELDAKADWSVALVRITVPNITMDASCQWADEYTDKAVLVPHRNESFTDFDLFVLGGGRAGKTFLGSIEFGEKGESVAVALKSVEVLRSEGIGLADKSISCAPSIQSQLVSTAPNPFNPQTTVEFMVAETASVDISIYGVSGRLVKTLVAGEMYDAGQHRVVWNGDDDDGRTVGAGLYLCRLKVDNDVDTLRMTLLK